MLSSDKADDVYRDQSPILGGLRKDIRIPDFSVTIRVIDPTDYLNLVIKVNTTRYSLRFALVIPLSTTKVGDITQ